MADQIKLQTLAGTATHTLDDSGNATHSGTVTAAAIVTSGGGELTIASGAIAVTGGRHTVDTEGDAATDDLDTITGGTAGMRVLLYPASAARTVVVKSTIGSNKIACPGGEDLSLAEGTDFVEIVYDGTQWEVAAYGITDRQAGAIVARGTIAMAAVRTLNATPVSLVAAPGAGKYIDGESMHWFLDYGTAAYDAAAAGDTLEARYTNGSGAALFDAVAGNAIGSASTDYHVLVRPVLEVIPVENAAVVAHINTGEWYSAAGDSPLKWEMVYRVRSFAFA